MRIVHPCSRVCVCDGRAACRLPYSTIGRISPLHEVVTFDVTLLQPQVPRAATLSRLHDVGDPHRSRLPRCSRCFHRRVLPRVARDGHVGAACKKAQRLVCLYRGHTRATAPWQAGCAHAREAYAKPPQATPLHPSPPPAPPLHPIYLYLAFEGTHARRRSRPSCPCPSCPCPRSLCSRRARASAVARAST